MRRDLASPSVAMLAVLAAVLMLAGCASTPPYAALTPPEGVTLSPLTPRALAQSLSGEAVVRPSTGDAPTVARTVDGPAVLWGGVIVAAEARGEATVLDIAAYPLRGQTPRLDQLSTGRFRAFIPQPLDPIDTPAGRPISVLGPVVALETAEVGEMTVTLPVVEADQWRLWPPATPAAHRDPRYDPWHDPWYGPWGPPRHGPPVRFGIGIGISR